MYLVKVLSKVKYSSGLPVGSELLFSRLQLYYRLPFSVSHILAKVLMLRRLKNLDRFKLMSVLTSALYFYLFVLLLLFPETLCQDFGITGNETVYFLSRRASMLMLGFAVLLFLVRNSPPSTVRQAIAISVSINMFGFALLGSVELIRGFVEKSILSAIVIEVFIAAIVFSFWLTDRHHREDPIST